MQVLHHLWNAFVIYYLIGQALVSIQLAFNPRCMRHMAEPQCPWMITILMGTWIHVGILMWPVIYVAKLLNHEHHGVRR